MDKNNIYYKREFLNLPGHQTSAYIIAEVNSQCKDGQPTVGWDGTFTSPQPETNLVISDCDRKISLDFTFYDKDDHKNNLHKVDTLIKTLQGFRTALADAYKDREKAKKTAKKLNKELEKKVNVSRGNKDEVKKVAEELIQSLFPDYEADEDAA